MKRELSILFTLVLAFQVITGSTAAMTLYVDDDGTGNYTTIQSAVNAAVNGDTIIVNPGTYEGDITLDTSSLRIQSQSENPEDTVIQGNGFYLTQNAQRIAIKGFTLKGTGSSYAIALEEYADSIIENNIILDHGTGIDTNIYSTFTINDNDISSCGTGIYVGECYFNAIINNNRVSKCGTGITVGDLGYPQIESNIIAENGQGIALMYEGGATIVGNTITSNKESGIFHNGHGGSTIYNNNFYNSNNIIFGEYHDFPDMWNTTRTAENNIVGGPYIAGNYWAKPDGKGFSQTHYDLNGDGIAEQPYYIDEKEIDYLPLVTPGTETEPVLPEADFRANTTYGSVPLTVAFTDLSKNAVSWRWDFNDNGKYDSVEQNPVFVYGYPADFTVNLTVINENGTSTKTAVITVLKKEAPILPAANFNANTTTGYPPLSVLFTDLSQNAASRSWDANGDGIKDSGEASFVYVYNTAGTYTSNLTVSNSNGTASKTATIIVLEATNSGGSSNDGSNEGGSSSGGSSSSGSSSGGSSSGGSSSGSSSGGGGGGGSPEPARNVKTKEISQTFIQNGKAVKFDFTKNATCVVYVGFDPKKNAGKTTTIVEELKSKSTLVSKIPGGETYKSFNVWVGNSGFASSKNIENPVICFKVEKSWIRDKNIDPDSIVLNRYSDKKWSKLEAKLSEEDDKFLYFIAHVPGFSFFVITGEAAGSAGNISREENGLETRALQGEDDGTAGPNAGLNSGQKEKMKFPDASPVYSIAGILLLSLICILIYKTIPK
ncbi:MAG: PGF-pre-PGF domain-containing protein [Methanosarcina mazei]|uniref:PGF-pre-PGF domain-containing protein n=1 Tax=Methanosarcina soligelidi TaxID=1036677 RepID=UPI00064E6A58|nr:PGF-pre-PGF domain-containing protein [Methanosarcina soligelidi]